ncbi:MAG: GAF domain-containing protein, partial [Anaerolineales bacterium]|nr:GAF domain-containing protein [Anaerolineales bacterium]
NAIAVPILLNGTLIGQIAIANKPTNFTEHDQSKLETIANYLAPLLQNRLEKEKKEQERKQAVEAMQRSEHIMRVLIDAIEDSLFLVETDGTIVIANSALATRFNRDLASLINSSIYDLTPHHVSQNRRAFAQKAIISGKPVHFEDSREGLIIANSIYPIMDAENRVTQLAIYGQDITEQRRAENELHESLQTAADIVASIPSGLFIYQYEPPDRLILLRGNKAAEQITGISPDEWIGKEFDELWPNARESGVTDVFLSPFRTGKPYETENLQYDDERLTGAYRIRAFLMPGNRLGVAFEDITKHRQIEVSEREQRALAEALVDTAEAINQTLDFEEVLNRILQVISNIAPHDGANIMLVDETTQTIQVVQHCKCYLHNGLQNPQLFVPWKLSDLPHLQQIIDTGKPIIIRDTYANAGWVRDKSINPIRSYLGTPILVEDKVIGILNLDSLQTDFFKDSHKEHLRAFTKLAAIAIQNARLHENVRLQLMQLREAQTRLIQSEKLAAIGELVAGVAHELNNPLTGVILYAQLLQRRKDKTAVEKDIQQIITQARRASDIVRGLLDFARQRPAEQTPTMINDVLQSTVSLLSYELRTHNVEVVTHFDPNLPLIMADQHQLQQVFVNLLSNALQAMETQQSGRIEIKTTLGRSQFLQDTGSPTVVRITFRDNGSGIPEALQTRIFDPFFTTKEFGKGTGLGLSVCHGIISEHGGHIWVKSTVGKGAKFFIELPIYQGETAVSATDEQPEEPAETNDIRILIVDDEQSLLHVMSLILKEYQVDQVDSGEAAMQKLATAVYDLIICDIHMPGMNGIKLYNHIEQAYPYLAKRFLFITGDTVSSHTKETLVQLGVTLLPKPFEMSVLLKTVNTLLAN